MLLIMLLALSCLLFAIPAKFTPLRSTHGFSLPLKSITTLMIRNYSQYLPPSKFGGITSKVPPLQSTLSLITSVMIRSSIAESDGIVRRVAEEYTEGQSYTVIRE